eukprot:NODE_206_length_1906_cov_102.586847_g182_i0.p1 GENE.NODE_206_length_1906_cov_102.586847_g182_i0~~NODE_206_length_1906_cov_102.586847_g182_i0.p1  ORF type:complete len:555 (-),score=130.92 NODE_206_length_1906_cov_102.586847_g182_i0:134-1798(-)
MSLGWVFGTTAPAPPAPRVDSKMEDFDENVVDISSFVDDESDGSFVDIGLPEEVAELEQQLKALQESYRKAREDVASREHIIVDLKKKVSSNTTDMERQRIGIEQRAISAERELKKEKSRVRDLQAELEKEKEALHDQLAAVQKRLDERSLSVSQQALHTQQLEKKLATMEFKHEADGITITTLQERNSELENDHDRLQQRSVQLRAQLDASEKRLQRVSAQLGEAAEEQKVGREAETTRLKQELLTKAEQADTLQTRLTESTRKLKNVERDMKCVQTTLGTTERRLRESEDEIQAVRARERAAAEQCKNDLDELRKVDALERQCTSAERTIADLRATNESIEATMVQLQGNNDEVSTLKHEVQLLSAEKTRNTELIESLQAELQIARQTPEGKEIARLKELVGKRDAEIIAIKQQVADMFNGPASARAPPQPAAAAAAAADDAAAQAPKPAEMQKVLEEKYPNRVPVKCRKAPDCAYPELSKAKYAVPNDMTMQRFVSFMRSKLGLDAAQAVVLIVETPTGERVQPDSSTTLRGLREQFVHSDGCLRVIYSEE